ncbi:MAG: hypothetical protein ACTSPY_17680 [Candidatus Helarchaeota archaeon]
MDENFKTIGFKLDDISQKIDKLTLSIKALILEFSKINDDIKENLSKLSQQIVAYNNNLNDTSNEEFEKSKNLLEEVYKELENISKSPTSNINLLNNKLEAALEIISQIVDPNLLSAQILKLKNYLSKIE